MEDKINVSELQLLKEKFSEVNADGSDGIEQDEFVSSFGPIMGGDLSEMQLKHLFMKIDADSNGTIDWDEFTNFMFLEKAENEDDGNRDLEWKLLPQDFVDKNPPHLKHKDFIDQIRYVSYLDKYMTTGRDGLLKLWSPLDLSLNRTVKLKGQSWVTDSCYMPVEKKIVVASTDRAIRFYDVNNRNTFDQVGALSTTGAMGVPMCVNCDMVGDKEHLFYGDNQGAARLLERNYYETGDMKSDDCPKMHDKHTDWVSKVMYVQDIQALITCSLDSKCMVTDLNHRVVKHEVELHTKGIYSFDWCRYYSMVASCGLERDIMLWHGNSGRKIGVLSGHTQSVMQVVSAEEQFQVISVDMHKVIKVWDLRNHKCVQSFVDDEHYRPENKIAAVFYDPRRRNRHARLITACQHPKIWPHVCVGSQYTGHDVPVCAALYNSQFDLVVSADDSSTVAVWDVQTGKRSAKFNNAHGTSKITAISFDASGRRLLTAANNGTVRMWNFNNGQLLKQFVHDEDELEITSVGYVAETSRGKHSLVIATSWRGATGGAPVLIWEDGGEGDVLTYRALEGHKEDILCIAYCTPNFLATGDYNGRIIVWNVTTGMRRLTLSHQDAPQFDRSVEDMVFLSKRGLGGYATLLTAGGDGMVRVFSLEGKGQVRHKLRGATADHDACSTLCTDETNSYVFVGDTSGHVRWWDVTQVGKLTGPKKNRLFPLEQSFIELAHFRPHEKAVTSLDYVDETQMLIVASVDTDISLWSTRKDGEVCLRLVGFFGQATAWKLGDPQAWVDKTGSDVPPPASTPEPYQNGAGGAGGGAGDLSTEPSSQLGDLGGGGGSDNDPDKAHLPKDRILDICRKTIQARRRSSAADMRRPQTVHSRIDLHSLENVPENVSLLKERIWAHDDMLAGDHGPGGLHGHSGARGGHLPRRNISTAPHGARRKHGGGAQTGRAGTAGGAGSSRGARSFGGSLTTR